VLDAYQKRNDARQRDEPHTRIEERTGEDGGGTSRDMTRPEEKNRGRYTCSKRKIKRKKASNFVDGRSERKRDDIGRVEQTG
jgi:hypothetical protein